MADVTVFKTEGTWKRQYKRQVMVYGTFVGANALTLQADDLGLETMDAIVLTPAFTATGTIPYVSATITAAGSPSNYATLSIAGIGSAVAPVYPGSVSLNYVAFGK
ncbi:MAG: hypothetical protein A7315_05960 [Candidatus Altiarchaeales archaeon WOR_SM1_79]|nr:MAG: hypothetical protein A7315_05960 [Candidatus Altiarchaeales archaeon WOR_SM1_79]